MWFAPVQVLTLVGCEMLQPPPPPEPEPTCDLAFNTLAGKTFVRQERSPDGKGYQEDVWARGLFKTEGDKLKLRYNTRSLVDMYDYTCTKGKGEILCMTDTPDLQQWCQTLIAHKGTCSPAELASLTGVPVEEATKAQADLMAKVDKMSEQELENMKLAYRNPNQQLRGLFHVKINKEECRITVRDTFQSMANGQLTEVDNFVGSARFVQYDKPLVFEKCKDDGLVALTAPDAAAKPGESKVQWKVGETIPFKYVGANLAKAEDGCTYKMDTWAVYSPITQGASVEPGPDGALSWRFDHKFDDHGKKMVHLYRYKACGGADAVLQDVSCAMVEISP